MFDFLLLASICQVILDGFHHILIKNLLFLVKVIGYIKTCLRPQNKLFWSVYINQGSGVTFNPKGITQLCMHFSNLYFKELCHLFILVTD